MLNCIPEKMFREHITSQISFIVYAGLRGIGKTTSIHNHIANCKEICQWDYIFISSKNQLTDMPLSTIALARGMKSTGCNYFDLYKDITSRKKTIIHIENPDELNRDALKLLDNAICFLLNSGNSVCKVIMEYDHTALNVSCFFSCMTHEKTIIQVLSSVARNDFILHLQSTCYSLSCDVAHKISETTQCNFGVLNELMLWLLSNQRICRNSDGKINCHKLREADIDLFKRESIEDKYSRLSNEQNNVISQASVVGDKVYTFLLQDALAMPNATKVLEKISTQTHLLYQTSSDGLYHFLQNIPQLDYGFIDGAHDYVLSHVPLYERYSIQKKLVDYLEVLFSKYNDQYMNERHMLLLARYYAGIDESKEIEYIHMAAVSYERARLPASAAVLYWDCYSKNSNLTEYAISTFRCLIQAEQYEDVDKLYVKHSLSNLKVPWIDYYFAKSQYCIGNVQKCIDVLIVIVTHGLQEFNLMFLAHSLLASSYDWYNNPKLRKRHFLVASKLVNRLSDDTRELARCSLWKKCTMCQSFELVQVKKHMLYAYQSYRQIGELTEAFECALNIGNEYLFSGDFENAYNYISKAYEGFLTIRSRQIYIAHNSMGMLFMVQGTYANALRHFESIKTDTIEPFCRISVEINKANAYLKLNRVAEAKEIIKELYDNSSFLSQPDMKIVAAHFFLTVAYICRIEHKEKTGICALNKAISICDASNANFSLLLNLCISLQEKWTEGKHTRMNYTLLSKLCCQEEITICDIMCWR